MKRSEALVPLSHDHHHGLVMALRMKKGGPASAHDRFPTDPVLQRDEVLVFAERELLPHFVLEEELLIPPCLRSGNPELEHVAAELLDEHASMRRVLAGLRQVNDPGILQKTMQSFGALLEPHIRKEERVFFPLAEAAIQAGNVALDTEALRTRHEAYHQPPDCDI